MNKNKKSLMTMVIVIVAILVAMTIIGVAFGTKLAKDMQEQIQTAEAEAAAETETVSEAVAEPVTEEAAEPETESEAVTEAETETETETESETETETETESEAVSEAAKTTHLENPKLDVGSYSSALIEWGSGGGKDNMNRPTGCLIDRDKYGDLGAYFLAPLEDETDKVVYLTFDIGYTNEATTSILDTLKEKGVHGVFFATLPVVRDQKEICNRIINEGHVLGNHSVTHTNMQAKSVEEQTNEIMQVHQAALDNYGYEMHLWRFPEGKFSEQSLAIVNNCNYRSVFWSFAYRDWITDAQPDVAEARRNAIDSLHPGAIYLLHGISTTNAAFLGDLIDAGREQGYRFEALD